MHAASPRLSPPLTPWPSLLIHGGVAALWLLLFARAFAFDGLLAWAVGVVYVSYDTALLGFTFWQTFGLAKVPTEALAPAPEPAERLAVIVAARNEAAVLPTTLAALFDQTEPADLVIVADDGSTDGTAALFETGFGLPQAELGALGPAGALHPSLRWLRVPHRGKAAALNEAIVVADAALILTVDADTVLDRGAIAAMRDAFAADPRLVAATGILTPLCGPTLGGRLFQWFQTYEYMRNFLSRYAWMRMDSLLLISGAFAAFRRDAVLEVGGFDPACLVEDYELIHRLRRHGTLAGRGWTTAVVGASRAVTDAPGSVAAFLRQRRRWFGGFLQTQYWYRDMVGNRRYGWLGMLMLPVKAADTLQPIFGLTALVLLVVSLGGGRLVVLRPVAGVIGLKLVVDIAFHLWSVHLYRRWAAPEARIGYGAALLAALVEPFSFQALRHLGAALGWVTVLTGRMDWGVQRRRALVGAPTGPGRGPREEHGGETRRPV